MHLFADDVQQSLHEAGWFAGRQVGVPAGEPEEPAAVRAFLSEFGGLRIHFHRNDGSVGVLALHAPNLPLAPETRDRQQHYGRELNRPFIRHIGTAYRGTMTLLMDETGTVYGAHEELLYRIGPTGEQAIETICLDLQFQPV